MSDLLITDTFLFFWDGWPSQWHPSPFILDGVRYNCCEQFMMAQKARLFRDSDAEAAIMASSSPRDQKAFGRKVRGFDAHAWDRVCRDIVYRGNLAKFEQNPHLKKELLGSGSRTIVEASPTDAIWGIGLTKEDPRALDPTQWRGTNWLGIAIMQVRDELSGVAGKGR